MKHVVIILVAVGCSIAVFLGLSVLDMDDLLKGELNSIKTNFGSTFFDCAKTFDELNSLAKKENSKENLITALELGFDMYDNRCFITVESWAHKSQNEQKIWESDWKNQSYLNQLYLEEIPCNNFQCQSIIDKLHDDKKKFELMKNR
ncbi:hypothetical protein AAA799B03_00963 [Marine Group I thaumarchaeote SCGC AAA799-B03]|uniref:Uncharacterized protein n=2 Tax=Marine Group I TaxID=905826 RepID=A0A087S6Y8_9ARCH|nr:hypothetical protein AAA799P11_01204 [Marine Group I thaumarchaeote SCGC AAA799-P11]KFM21492.1 hypothetical protein AAA799B03_00963 [Marine Group I thaumarchaeote SCGC AAA799-B03]